MIKKILLYSMAILTISASGQNFEWSEQNSNVTDILRDVYFANNLNGWAVGENGTVLNTKDGGETWTPQTISVTERIRAVFAIDELNAFLVGGENNKIMIKTADGGTTWQNLDPNNHIDNNQILDVCFWSQEIGWVITNDSVYHTNDGGDSWEKEEYVSSISSVQNRSITATSDTTAFVASRRNRSGIGTFADVFYRLKGHVQPWVQSSSALFNSSDGGMRSIEFADFSTGFAGGEMGILYRSDELAADDLSGPWNISLDLSSTNPNLINSISFPTASTGMFAIGTTENETNYLLVYHTNDKGDSWSTQPDSIEGLLQGIIHSPDISSAWAVGSFGKIFKGVPSTSSINQLRLNIDINIYPNPSTDLINLELNGKDKELISYSMTEISGRIIKEGNWSKASSSSTLTLDVSKLSRGVYLLTIITTDGQGTFRVLKK